MAIELMDVNELRGIKPRRRKRGIGYYAFEIIRTATIFAAVSFGAFMALFLFLSWNIYV